MVSGCAIVALWIQASDAPDEEGIAFRAERISRFDSRGFQRRDWHSLDSHHGKAFWISRSTPHAADAILKAHLFDPVETACIKKSSVVSRAQELHGNAGQPAGSAVP